MFNYISLKEKVRTLHIVEFSPPISSLLFSVIACFRVVELNQMDFNFRRFFSDLRVFLVFQQRQIYEELKIYRLGGR